jgi:hypothetical protein
MDLLFFCKNTDLPIPFVRNPCYLNLLSAHPPFVWLWRCALSLLLDRFDLMAADGDRLSRRALKLMEQLLTALTLLLIVLLLLLMMLLGFNELVVLWVVLGTSASADLSQLDRLGVVGRGKLLHLLVREQRMNCKIHNKG